MMKYVPLHLHYSGDGEGRILLNLVIALIGLLLVSECKADQECIRRKKSYTILKDAEFSNSSYSTHSRRIAGRPRKLSINSFHRGVMNITWENPAVYDTSVLQGFRIEISGIKKYRENNLDRYSYTVIDTYYLLNETAMRDWVFDCVNVSKYMKEKGIYRYKVIVQPLPLKVKDLSTDNNATLVLLTSTQFSEGTGIAGYGWLFGFAVRTEPTNGGRYLMDLAVPRQGDGKDINMDRAEISVNKDLTVTCNRQGGIWTCDRISSPLNSGCYELEAKTAHANCSIGQCRTYKGTSCQTYCSPISEIFVTLGKDQCCTWDSCTPTTSTMLGTTKSVQTTAVMVTSQTNNANNEEWLSLLSIPMLGLCVIIVSIAVYLRLKGPSVKRGILIIYSDDHPPHMQVIENFVHYLKEQCKQKVFFYKNAPDSSSKTKEGWCLEKLQTTQNIIVVVSDYSCICYAASQLSMHIPDSEETGSVGIALTAFHQLKTTVALKQNQNIFYVCFPYTRRDLTVDISNKHTVYRLMEDGMEDQMDDFCGKLLGSDSKFRSKYELPQKLSNRGNEALCAAIKKSKQHQEEHPNWCKEKYSKDVERLQKLINNIALDDHVDSKSDVSVPNTLLPPSSFLSDTTTAQDIIHWLNLTAPSIPLQNKLRTTGLYPPTDTNDSDHDSRSIDSGGSIRSRISVLDNKFNLLSQGDNCPDDQIDSISQTFYDSGLGTGEAEVGLTKDTSGGYSLTPENLKQLQRLYSSKTKKSTSDERFALGCIQIHSPESVSENDSLDDMKQYIQGATPLDIFTAEVADSYSV